MISSDDVISKNIHIMPIFNCEGYKLEGGSWVKLQKIFIDDQFDDKNHTGIEKIKIKGQKGYQNTYMTKITFNNHDYFYSITQQLQIKLLTHIVANKTKESTQLIPTSQQYINVCAGNIYKKSNFLGEWETYYVAISQEGLTASKEQKGQIQLKIEGVKEIWTRFELIKSNKFMVFKVRDFFKYEFGVPSQWLLKWAKAFYSLINFD